MAWLYWVSFEILGAFMLLNLFVAIVIDHFEESRKLSGPDCPLEADDIEVQVEADGTGRQKSCMATRPRLGLAAPAQSMEWV